MKEYRVKFKYEEDDSYVELWQIVGQRKYIGRFTCGPKEWVYVSDPLGYREMDHSLSKDDVVIVCDQAGKELFRTRNGDGSANFNTPKQEAFEQWAAFCKTLETKVEVENQSALFFAHWATGRPVGQFNGWLLSFKDPDMYPEANDYDENWIWYLVEQVGDPETLFTYTFLGEEKKIERIRKKHKACGVEWDDFYSGDYFIGSAYDSEHVGTMFSEAEARQLVAKAIKENHPDADYGLSYVTKCTWGSLEGSYVQKNVTFSHAVDRILDGDFHRENVRKKADEERKHSHYYGSGSNRTSSYSGPTQGQLFLNHT